MRTGNPYTACMHFPVELPDHFLVLAAELHVNPADIEEHFIRGHGHGGQKINKTASMVFLKHRPTGIEVKIQPYRQQHLNRIAAYKLLLLKIEEHVKGEQSALQREGFKIRKQKQRRSRRAKEKILREKHHHAHIKEGRRSIL